MKLVRVGVLLGLAAAQTLVWVSPAAAATATTVTVSRGQLVVQAGADVANKIHVTESDGMLFVSDVVSVSPGEDCKRVQPGEVACPATGIGSVLMALGDGDDTAEIKISLATAILAGFGNDHLTGGSTGDTFHGGPGNDVVFGGGGADSLYGDDGQDTLSGDLGDDYLQGGTGTDKMFGGPDNDTLQELPPGAQAGNVFHGGSGDDKLLGIAGMRDMAIYSTPLMNVGVNLSSQDFFSPWLQLPAGTGGQLDANGILVEHDTISNLHDIRTSSGSDVLIGSGNAPILDSGSGADLCDPNGNDGFQLTSC
jgi:Ca2+-binding RTX toxin-like protein